MSASKNTVDSTSTAYDIMLPRLRLGETLLGGTPAMRDAEKTYLPQYERESDDNYNNRLEKAVLFNAYKKTLNGTVGRVFSKPVTLNEGAPPQLEEMTTDIDRQGNDLTTWGRNSFRDGVSKGLTHCLIDFPEIDADNAEEELAQKPVPYFNMIPHENLIAAYATVIDGKEVLTQIRIREVSVVVIGFEEQQIERIRVITPGEFAVYEKTDGDDWAVVEQGTYDLTFIPLVTFYAERDDFMLSTPPLSDLGYLNVAHWQFTSDLQNTLTVASFPMLAVAGADSDQKGKIVVGPKQLLSTKKESGRFYFVEHTGASIEANRNYLQDVEGQMALEGVNLLRQRPGTQTATQRAMDGAEETSDLREMAIRFEDFLNTCFNVAAAWLDLEQDSAVVNVNTDGLILASKDAAELDLLYNMCIAGKLSWMRFFTELKRRGVLADDVNFDEERALIADQPQDDMGMFNTPSTTVDDTNDSE